jgi:hypothetical protein
MSTSTHSLFSNVNIKSTVLPSLRGKKDELLLRELLRRWPNHKERTCQRSKYFSYLDRYHARRHQLPSLQEIGFVSFYYLVYDELNKQVMDAILAMIDQKHAREPIDETLVNKALTFTQSYSFAKKPVSLREGSGCIGIRFLSG